MKQSSMATNSEIELERYFGRQNPFRVPDGYFSDFEKKLLVDIAVMPVVRKQHPNRLRIFALAASAAAAVVCGVVFYVGEHTTATQSTDVANVKVDNNIHNSTELAIDEMSDYAMLDNGDIYYYLTGE